MTKNPWVTGGISPRNKWSHGPLLITGDGTHLSATDRKNPDMSYKKVISPNQSHNLRTGCFGPINPGEKIGRVLDS